MENKIEMKWEIKEWGKDYCSSGQYENKYYIELEIWDIANEDAAKVCQSYSDDWDIANELYLDVEDYIFYLAKWGKVQKEVGRCLYWETRENAQFAIDQLTAKLILDKITK